MIGFCLATDEQNRIKKALIRRARVISKIVVLRQETKFSSEGSYWLTMKSAAILCFVVWILCAVDGKVLLLRSC